MHLAIQVGLHMPDYAQDFSKGELTLRREDLKDRYTTWTTCNIVAQRYVPAHETQIQYLHSVCTRTDFVLLCAVLPLVWDFLQQQDMTGLLIPNQPQYRIVYFPCP